MVSLYYLSGWGLIFTSPTAPLPPLAPLLPSPPPPSAQQGLAQPCLAALPLMRPKKPGRAARAAAAGSLKAFAYAASVIDCAGMGKGAGGLFQHKNTVTAFFRGCARSGGRVAKRLSRTPHLVVWGEAKVHFSVASRLDPHLPRVRDGHATRMASAGS